MKYINTNNLSDEVTLDTIFRRYLVINGSCKGFEEYVKQGFLSDCGEAEYVAVKEIERDTCINAAFDLLIEEINKFVIDCQFKVDAYQLAYFGLEYMDGFKLVIKDEETVFLRKPEEESPKKFYAIYNVTQNDIGYTITKFGNKEEL